MVLARASVERKRRPVAGSDRLDLSIGGTAYRVEFLTVGPAEPSRAFRLTKRDGTTYDVAQMAHGPECDCPDFIFRRDGIDPEGCKHLRAMVKFGLIERGQPRRAWHS